MTTSEIRNSQGERLDHTFHLGTRSETLVILGHGVTGNKDRPLLIAVAEGLSKLGWPCLRISYAGNGESEGRFEDCTISKEIGDLKAVLDNVPDYVRPVYIGHSMGGAVGVLTAAQDYRIQLLVSLAGMTHTADFVQREFGNLVPGQDNMWGEPGCPLSQAYVDNLTTIGDTLSAAATLIQPWLLVHGTADDVVPAKDSEDAFNAASIQAKSCRMIPGAGHTFDEAGYPQIVLWIHEWLTAHFGLHAS